MSIFRQIMARLLIPLSLTMTGAAIAAVKTFDAPAAADTSGSTPVKVIRVESPAGAAGPVFAGRVHAGETALLAFRVAGQLQTLHVHMGDRVKQGQVLAELDPTDYQLNVEARQAEFDLAQLEAERADKLFGRKLISEDQFDTAQTLLATSGAKLEQAREQLSFCLLSAPFSGNIAFTYAMPSEIVGPQLPIINLQDTSSLEIHINLPPQYQPLLRGEEQASFLVSHEFHPGEKLAAQFEEIGMRPDPDTNSYPLTLRLAGWEGLSIWPGMPVQVELHHPRLFSGKWVPPGQALFARRGNTARVWRIDEGTMTVSEVEVQLDPNGALVGGLNPGDRVVAAGVDRLREGQKVRPWVREGGL
jgi:RND family efflux transporter MFP subunit